MKIELNKESASAAILSAIKNNSCVYVDCNGKCYTEETRPNKSEMLTAEIWRAPMYWWHYDEKLGEEVKLFSNDLLNLPPDELEEVISSEVQEIDTERSLDAILELEDELFDTVLWTYHLPQELEDKVRSEFNFMREIAGDWDTCRAQEEVFPFFFDHNEVEVLMQNATHETHTFESIVAIFNDAEKQLLTSAKSVSESIYKASLHNLLVEWERKEIADTMMHFFCIEKDTIHLFTIHYSPLTL